MSQTPKEAFTRVVAIAVQSLMNRHQRGSGAEPRRGVGGIAPEISLHAVEVGRWGVRSPKRSSPRPR